MARLARAPQTVAPDHSPFTKRIEKRVLSFVLGRDLLRSGERVVVGVSGGPDSTALLLLLARLKDELALDITVAHFDHMLRSRSEAAADESYVRSLATSLGRPFVRGSGNVPARVRRTGESVEDAARRMRYAFLAKESRRFGATAVVVGHTLDDQAESVLMHVLRGSGLDGLVAMRGRSGWPIGRGPELARPLLTMTRVDTERYCRELGEKPRSDPTNDLSVATRNRLRKELLPALRSFNPRVEEALARLAEAAGRDVEYLELEANTVWRRTARVSDDGVSFAREELAEMHPAIVARLIRRAICEVAGTAADLEAVHVERLLASLRKRRERVTLPHGVTAVLDAGSLRFRRGESAVTAPILETPLVVLGVTAVTGWRFEVTAGEAPGSRRTGRLEALLDVEALRGRPVVRSRRAGDRLRPLGLGGWKKVQDVLVDAKVAAEERDGVPIVCDEAGVVWVVGHCIDARVALGPGSTRALRIRASRVD
jgi:tRNA(Ile)-lysidine synthase